MIRPNVFKDEQWKKITKQIKSEVRRKRLEIKGNDGTVVEKVKQLEGGRKVKACYEKGNRLRNYGRWSLCSSADVRTVGGQGRWVVALKWVLTESFLTWRFTRFFSVVGGQKWRTLSTRHEYLFGESVHRLLQRMTNHALQSNYLYSIQLCFFSPFYLRLSLTLHMVLFTLGSFMSLQHLEHSDKYCTSKRRDKCNYIF